MSDHSKLWEKIDKMPGGNKDPFETPLGPTSECLSSDQLVAYIRDKHREPKIVEHLSRCSFCSERVIRFN